MSWTNCGVPRAWAQLYKAGSDSMEDDHDDEIEGGARKFFYDRLTNKESWKYDDNDLV
ncbi:hypothetical protein [Shewanella psychrotolerans]|uniref:hypothetical protein n=1 Tax=Shewanella psychrotolerans TaxID=2864206 RepID=UPI001C6608FE|nr:hypothetical protein [Shewanella psychrotolerans]QYK02348.1 hypothetical protein K0I62_05140 [Shewanella psychrotolerans]